MLPMKRGKYVGHDFTAEQQEARKLWQRADKYMMELHDALHIIPTRTRKELHTRLDKRLDDIERTRSKARELFPDVGESFTVATMQVTL